MATNKAIKTGRYLYVRWNEFGWNFRRAIWQNENGKKFIRVNRKPIDLDYVLENANGYFIDIN